MYIFNLYSQQQNGKQRSASLRFVQVLTYKVTAILDPLSVFMNRCQNFLEDCIANAFVLCLCLLLQGKKKLEEAFQHGKHAIDDLVNVAKVLTAVVFLLSWRISG